MGTPARRFNTLVTLSLLTAVVAPSAQQTKQFDVASIRETKSTAAPYTNFPMNPGPQYNNEGGLLVARNIPLLQLFVFAYTHSMYQIQQLRDTLPDWVRYTRYDVQARAEGRPTKDEMRQMVRSMLEERFHIKEHTETRELPVFRLIQVRPGKFGPNLSPSRNDEPPCAAFGPYAGAAVPTISGGLPEFCGILLMLPGMKDNQFQLAGRKLTMIDLARGIEAATNTRVDRPIIDGTGFDGTFDVTLHFTPENSDPDHAEQNTVGLPLADALRDQLGLKLQAGKGPVEVVVLDHIEKPTEN
jgi:uncharacterized protein (TIGR03435 family)